MANVIQAVVTEDFLKYRPQMLGGIIPHQIATSFKVGEAGWIDEGAGRVPRTPDPALRRFDNDIQDLDAVVDPTRPPSLQRYPADSLGVFEKTLAASDLVFLPPSTLRVRCFLDLADFGAPPGGLPAEMYEIGIFSDHPTIGGEKLMLAYGTYPQELKDGSRQLENIVLITYGGS